MKREGNFSNYCHERPHHHYYLHFHCHHRHHALVFLCRSVRKMFGLGEEMQILLVLTSTKMVLMEVPVLKMQILPMLTKKGPAQDFMFASRDSSTICHAPTPRTSAFELLSILDAQSPLLSIHLGYFWGAFVPFMRPRSDNLGLLSLMPLLRLE